jgi:hypothetical protein
MHPFSAFAEEIAAERRLLKVLRLQAKALELRLWLRKYSPDQPRVPAGNPDGGQWTSGSGGGFSDLGTFGLDDGIDGLFGGDGTGQPGDGGGSNDPELPIDRPPRVAERVGLLKQLAEVVIKSPLRWLAILDQSPWVKLSRYSIEPYNDPPKELGELISDVNSPRFGYQVHHIVEQSAARRDGFPEHVINSRENLVLVPTMKHWEITSWFMTSNDDYGGDSPRNYLQGRSWDVRKEVGLQALRRAKVLK